MSRTIWKYNLDHKRNEIEMPVGAKVIFVGSQDVARFISPPDLAGETIMMWVEVEPDAAQEKRTFLVYGTGWPLPEIGEEPQIKHRGSVLLNEKRLVFHVYEERYSDG